MIPPEWRLKAPEGIDDERSRAFATLLEERLGGIPIERVLVWHTDTVVESALAHLAELLDVDMVAHGVDQTRVLLEQAVERIKRRGTPSAVEETVAALGFETSTMVEHPVILRDGSIRRDGAHVHGYDGQWPVFQMFVDAGVPGVSFEDVARQVERNKRLVTRRGTTYALQSPGGADVLATDDGFVLALDAGTALAIEVLENIVLATDDGFALATDDGFALAMVNLGAPLIVGWHRSDGAAYAWATENLEVIVTDDGSPIVMLEAS